MSGTQNIGGAVLGASTAVGLGLGATGASMLPVTGGTPVAIILGLVALACGLAILGTLSITEYLEKRRG